MKNGKLKLSTYRKSFEYAAIASKGVAKVIKENDKRGIPSVFSIDGEIYYKLANGKLTTKSPFKKQKRKP